MLDAGRRVADLLGFKLRRWEEANGLFAAVADGCEASQGADDAETLTTRSALSVAMEQTGDVAGARVLYEDLLCCRGKSRQRTRAPTMCWPYSATLRICLGVWRWRVRQRQVRTQIHPSYILSFTSGVHTLRGGQASDAHAQDIPRCSH